MKKKIIFYLQRPAVQIKELNHIQQSCPFLIYLFDPSRKKSQIWKIEDSS